MRNKLFQARFWPDIEKTLRRNYGRYCTILTPRRLKIKLKSGKIVQIEKSWYDVLVLEPAYGDTLVASHDKDEISVNTPGIHCIEIKFSQKEKPHEFGAFTIGEWITAYLSHTSQKFSYELYFVNQIKGSSEVRISRIPITDKVLADMLVYPQIKLYYYAWFLKENQQTRLTPHIEAQRTRARVGPALEEINKTLISMLYSFIEKE